ncbi:MAG TPA: hypothetical protein VN905_00525 [Candidatus Binatia bacterium]|nr:hypothetical protein [Candidatus Binatia bacterium]
MSSAHVFRLLKTGVDTRAVNAQSRKPFRFLLCGDPALVSELRRTFLAGHDGFVPLDAAATLETIDISAGRTILVEDAKCILFLGRGNDAAGARLDVLTPLRVPIFAITVDPQAQPAGPGSAPERGKIEHYIVPALDRDALRPKVIPHVVDCCKGHEIAVARRLPAFRDAVAAKLTRDAASNSLKVAMASGLVDHIPVLGFVVGAVASAGDMIAITGIQTMLTMQIGAAYGRDPEMSHVWELLPVVGGGFGWRALSRELTGFVPVAGVLLKGAIAYAGTMVVGESVNFFYQHGRHMSRADAAKLYEEAKSTAMQFARDLIDRLRKR